MKVRTGFVSNSSSSSFIIYKSDLTMEEFEQIKDHEEVAGTDSWWVDDTERDFVRFSTHMDNFSLYSYIRDNTKIDLRKIHIEEY